MYLFEIIIKKYLLIHSLEEGSMVEKSKCDGNTRMIDVCSLFRHSDKPFDVKHITASLWTLDVPLKVMGVVERLDKNSKSL